MAIRVSNLRVGLEGADVALPAALARTLGVRPGEFQHRILRKSLDTRDKADIHFVYSAEVRVPDDEAKLVEKLRGQRRAVVELFAEPPFAMPSPGTKPLGQRPVVIGSGPGGLVAAYFLAEAGYCPLVLERGPRVSRRIRDVKTFDGGGAFEPDSNYLYGEGGAGTFSDGKLTCRSTGPDVQRVLELFAACKGKPSILYEHRPHLGSNRLPAVVKAIRQRVEALGGDVRFNCTVEDLDLDGDRLRGLHTSQGYLPAEVALLAIGHSARDTFAMLLKRGVPMERKPFQMGVRIEHTQATVNRVQYGRQPLEGQLGAADYSLVAKGRPHDVFTFCMCAGGTIIPSVSSVGHFSTNGMSLSRRDLPYANSGLMMTVPLEAFGGSDVMAGVRLQEQFERAAHELGGGEYACPVQHAGDFMAGRASSGRVDCSYPRGVVPTSLERVLPGIVVAALREALPQMDRRWGGRFVRDAVLAGPEARGSSPVRIVRDAVTRESPIHGLYPVGEGAGYAGGIISAAVDGLRTAKAVVAEYAALTTQFDNRAAEVCEI